MTDSTLVLHFEKFPVFQEIGLEYVLYKVFGEYL